MDNSFHINSFHILSHFGEQRSGMYAFEHNKITGYPGHMLVYGFQTVRAGFHRKYHRMPGQFISVDGRPPFNGQMAPGTNSGVRRY